MPQVSVRKLVEGASHVVIRVDMLNDDSSGELTQQVILAPADCSPPLPASNIYLRQPAFRIMQLWYGCVWFDVVLGMNTLQPKACWVIAKDCDSHNDFRSFGGLVDPIFYEPPPYLQEDSDGKLWISTNGFNVLGSTGTVVIELRKLQKDNP